MKKKIVSAAGILAIGASLAFAGIHEGRNGGEGHRGGHGGRGGFSQRMAEKLNLTEAQRTQIQTIRKSTHEQNAAFFETARLNHEEFKAAREANDTAKLDSLKANMVSQHAQMKQIREDEMARMLSVLTPEQKAQFEKMKAEREARRAEREKNGEQGEWKHDGSKR